MTEDEKGDYETQGFYGGRWGTHMSGMSLDRTIRVYTWFKRGADANKGMGYGRTSPTNARIVHTPTGEVVPPPELEQGVFFPGTHAKIKTISCTEEEFKRVCRDVVMWGNNNFVHERKDGTKVYKWSHDYVFGYQMPDGSYRIRPGDWKPAIRKAA